MGSRNILQNAEHTMAEQYVGKKLMLVKKILVILHNGWKLQGLRNSVDLFIHKNRFETIPSVCNELDSLFAFSRLSSTYMFRHLLMATCQMNRMVGEVGANVFDSTTTVQRTTTTARALFCGSSFKSPITQSSESPNSALMPSSPPVVGQGQSQPRDLRREY